MVIVLIRRFVRLDKEKEFLTAYRARPPISLSPALDQRYPLAFLGKQYGE